MVTRNFKDGVTMLHHAAGVGDGSFAQLAAQIQGYWQAQTVYYPAGFQWSGLMDHFLFASNSMLIAGEMLVVGMHLADAMIGMHACNAAVAEDAAFDAFGDVLQDCGWDRDQKKFPLADGDLASLGGIGAVCTWLTTSAWSDLRNVPSVFAVRRRPTDFMHVPVGFIACIVCVEQCVAVQAAGLDFGSAVDCKVMFANKAGDVQTSRQS